MKSAQVVNFPHAILGQFILMNASEATTLKPHPLRGSWIEHEIEGIYLATAPGLGVIQCQTADGRTIGFFIGDPVDFTEGCLVLDERKVTEPPAGLDELERWIEETVYRYGGRYVFVLTSGPVKRVYVDAAGSLPLVYDKERKVAGSTAGAIYDEDEFADRFDAALFDRMRLLEGGWFPAGLTPHRGLQRLLANFYIDLADWTTHRHWPRDIEQNSDGPAAAERLGSSIRKGTRTFLTSGRSCLALTGGHETRLLLATAREWASSAVFFCLSDADAARDRLISSRLARRFGLNLRILPFPQVTDAEAEQWMARTGYCAGEHRYRYKGVQQLDDFDFRIGGTAGEVGRGFYWRPGDGDAALTARDLYARLALPADPTAEQAVANWFDTLPTRDPLLQLDLAYLELRLSCWFAVQTYGSIGPSHAYPLISREVFTRMLQLPAEWRRANRWMIAVIRSFWPELLEVPINDLGRVRETIRLVQRAVRRPSLVARRLKRRFG